MKACEIRVDQTKNLGNYENIKLGLTVAVEEGEDLFETVEKAVRLIDWQINRNEREPMYRKYKQQLASGVLNGETAKIEAWIAKFESLAAEFAPDLVIETSAPSVAASPVTVPSASDADVPF